jgi:hypothetical protein
MTVRNEAALVMSDHTRDRSRDDHEQRGPLGKVRRPIQQQHHERHHRGPAADAEQRGE